MDDIAKLTNTLEEMAETIDLLKAELNSLQVRGSFQLFLTFSFICCVYFLHSLAFFFFLALTFFS
jgi:hypothetical protein